MMEENIKTRTLLELIEDIREHIQGDVVTVKSLLEAFHERGFGFFLFLIALPAALPIPALGVSTIIALPLLMLTVQQALGRHMVWLPQKWQAKEIASSKIESFIKTAEPWIKRLQFFIKPRISCITQGVFSHLIGVSGVFMALAVALPLPLTNTVPAFGIALMAIGVLMRDGLAVIAGMVIGTLWVTMLLTLLIVFGSEGVDLIKEFIKGIF